ncbi:LacI family DNA-binding transcriptional regulator [Heyndrickxia oleronia]|jgi:DNA-binding LacI/PurR family transcriptional regulator|uniref:LacI family transcriptional regulator n=1 Tax=Heyndrickxia oleronia TaxID=38875 RepID=A0A8E2LCQ0_9BACI|nr:LacI family DNA-binding transcriptional regulator [Heyndrickxia oleronia]OJH16756.1 LacI family transcriptional regulator [Bacillus obstructivus]MCI1591071.1 LacI family DNA-binding transcriptional regulator [Heyndrickxia oleronia]MCI1614703.1 LacI family DNA-binding transcriptional regulator [Heyndrickxia oleronia]MCI1745578.1 LacI family DNA-binding transcriptional regulator [Heyndrickxia oleronia]MCI1762463.1 LacI family DNA-binding transcriptional regulator [Heyndrickxia oleronia]
MANIREIAKLAGVSVTTVSRVINNHPYVSENKRKAVLKAMETLNYKRNIHAIHLAKGRSNMIGIVLPNIDHPYFSQFVEGVAEEAIKHHLQIVLFQTNYEIAKELDALESLRGNLIDGLIFCSRAISLDILYQYNDYGSIVLCEDSDQSIYPSISIPHEQAFQFGLEYLIAKGHTKIAYTLGRREGPNSFKRMQAYEKMMKRINQNIRKEWIFDKCLSITDGSEVMSKFKALKEKPTAFLATNDQVAAGLLLGAKKLGYTVPNDIAILSFDNQPIAELMDISSISIPIKKIGALSVSTLLDTNNQSSKKMILPFKLYERSTV